MLGLSKSFTCEVRDLYPNIPQWITVTCFYDGDELCPQPIQDEFGRNWSLKELSIHDLAIIDRHLVYNLSADQASDDIERAEERMAIHTEAREQ